MPTRFATPARPRYWGGDMATQGLYDQYWQQDQANAKRQRDLEFFDRYGYFPEQQGDVKAALGAGENEYQQLIAEIQSAIGRLDEDSIAKDLQSHFGNVMGGQDLPYDEQAIQAMMAEATSPIMGGAQNAVSRARENFAARGLGRSGGLGSMEARLMQEAVTNAARERSRIRGEATTANYGARAGAAQNMAGFYQSQSSMRNQLAGLLAQIRSQKSFDPAYFSGGQNRNYQTAGGGFNYSPPQSLERRSTGTSAPKYASKFPSAWDIFSGRS